MVLATARPTTNPPLRGTSLYWPSKARDVMTPARRILGRWMLVACFACLPAYAQDTQFLPEIDAHLTFNHYVRGYLQAKDDREGGDPRQKAKAAELLRGPGSLPVLFS